MADNNRFARPTKNADLLGKLRMPQPTQEREVHKTGDVRGVLFVCFLLLFKTKLILVFLFPWFAGAV